MGACVLGQVLGPRKCLVNVYQNPGGALPSRGSSQGAMLLASLRLFHGAGKPVLWVVVMSVSLGR